MRDTTTPALSPVAGRRSNGLRNVLMHPRTPPLIVTPIFQHAVCYGHSISNTLSKRRLESCSYTCGFIPLSTSRVFAAADR